MKSLGVANGDTKTKTNNQSLKINDGHKAPKKGWDATSRDEKYKRKIHWSVLGHTDQKAHIPVLKWPGTFRLGTDRHATPEIGFSINEQEVSDLTLIIPLKFN